AGIRQQQAVCRRFRPVDRVDLPVADPRGLAMHRQRRAGDVDDRTVRGRASGRGERSRGVSKYETLREQVSELWYEDNQNQHDDDCRYRAWACDRVIELIDDLDADGSPIHWEPGVDGSISGVADDDTKYV